MTMLYIDRKRVKRQRFMKLVAKWLDYSNAFAGYVVAIYDKNFLLCGSIFFTHVPNE